MVSGPPPIDVFSFESMKTPRSIANWGMVIQGPSVSTGLKGKRLSVPDSPIVNPLGYDCLKSVSSTVAAAEGLFSHIVISTWTDSGFGVLDNLEGLSIVETDPPADDWDNRRKQFLSTQRGLELLEKIGITHVVKVRTDQTIPREILEWIVNKATCEDVKQDQIVVSDMIASEIFYVGDFLWAGRLDSVTRLVRAVNSFGFLVLDPVVTKDWVLKFALSTDVSLTKVLSRGPSLPIQLRDPRNESLREYWLHFRDENFTPIPRGLLAKITWRGRAMSDIIDMEAFLDASNQASSVYRDKRRLGISGALVTLATLLKDLRRFRRTHPHGKLTHNLKWVIFGPGR